MDDAKRRAQATYDSAAQFFDDPALSFWDRFGKATIDRLGPQPGHVILDACAGSGASAVPAAHRVGPSGKVIAVDLADNLLALARAKADFQGLVNLETRHADIEALEYPPGAFDAVVIVFGLFFLPDMAKATAVLWQLVKPGGRLAVTTWGPRLWEPANSVFWDAVDRVRPDLTRWYNPWEALADPQAVVRLLRDAGAESAGAESFTALHPLESAEDFWTIVKGSGYRATYDAMSATEREAVRELTLNTIARRKIDAIETNVVFATATKPVNRTRSSPTAS